MAKAALFDMTDAAIAWRDRALLTDQALFSDEEIWSMVNLRALWVALTREKVDLRRLETLGEQLRGVEGEVVRLTAELFWLMYLASGPTCISHARKTDIVRTIYEWSGETLSSSHPLLKETTQSFTGGPGLFFNARRSEELLFLIKAIVGVKKKSNAERKALLADPAATGRMFDEAAGDESPQLSHILRFLLFPEHYEPVFTTRDKRRIVESFSGIPRKETRRWSATRLDEELGSIRKQLQPLYGEQTLSFLQEPLVSTWRHGGARGDVSSSEQRFWVEKSTVEAQPHRNSGPDRLGQSLWTPRQSQESEESSALMREVEPGDVIFHFTDNAGISGVSLVEGEIEENFVCPEDTRWSGKAGYRIALGEFTEVTPMLNQSVLLMGPKFQDELRRLAEQHGALFFNRQLTLNRGRYLSDAPEGLVRIFNEAYRQESNRHLPHVFLPDQEDLKTTIQEKSFERVQHPLTQILSGPTGTGKTYTAMVRAVEICDGTAPGNHDQLMKRYNELQTAGRIRLITFHPSFGYRDFIEGHQKETVRDSEDLDPVIVDSIKPGVFKAMAHRASVNVHPEEPSIDLADTTIWKVTPETEADEGTDVPYDDLIEGQFICCPAGGELDFSAGNSRANISALLLEASGESPDEEAVSAMDQLVNQMAEGDLVILVDSTAACRAIGRVTGGYRPSKSCGGRTYTQTRSVEWLAIHRTPQPWARISRKAFLPRGLYRLDGSLLRLEELGALLEQRVPDSPNYVLIIDEIGRGNIAQIFGELVTLIEPDKRTGAANALNAVLPISGESFSVPDNLYLIGTLNSADPVEATNADVLHRRFEFEELSPDASLIRGDDQLGTIPDDEGDRIDLRLLMVTINRRIEFLAGREHRLGQGYFMHIRSYDDLLQAIRSRILPHLRALFVNDWRKVQLIFRDVLSDGQPNIPQVIGHEDLNATTVLGFELDEFHEQTRFWVTPDRDLTPEAFRKIYSER